MKTKRRYACTRSTATRSQLPDRQNQPIICLKTHKRVQPKNNLLNYRYLTIITPVYRTVRRFFKHKQRYKKGTLMSPYPRVRSMATTQKFFPNFHLSNNLVLHSTKSCLEGRRAKAINKIYSNCIMWLCKQIRIYSMAVT